MPDAAEPTPDSLDALIASADAELSDLAGAEKAANLLRKGRDRTWIARTIIVTYSAAILGMFLYLLFTVPSCPADMKEAACKALANSWDNQAGKLLDLITIAILPVVTLMLGFYFGTERTAASTPDSIQS